MFCLPAHQQPNNPVIFFSHQKILQKITKVVCYQGAKESADVHQILLSVDNHGCFGQCDLHVLVIKNTCHSPQNPVPEACVEVVEMEHDNPIFQEGCFL